MNDAANTGVTATRHTVREAPALSSRGHEPARLARSEPPQNGEVRLSVEGPGATTYAQVCYRFPAASHPDFFALSVLDSLLAGPSNLNMFSGGISNKTSRLYRALVDKELAVSIHGGSQATTGVDLLGSAVRGASASTCSVSRSRARAP